MPDTKTQLAMDFINSIRKQNPRDLNARIVGVVGEDLAQFFLQYSAALISKCDGPDVATEVCASLMLMGYLTRANEEDVALVGATQARAVA